MVCDTLRQAVVEYLSILDRQQREALGDSYAEFVEELEQITTGTRELAAAKKRLQTLVEDSL